MARLTRTTLGPHFTEGGRQLWLLMIARGWDQAHMSAELGAGAGTLSKILYGDRGAGLGFASAAEARLGVSHRLFQMPPLESFTPPAAAGLAGAAAA